MKTIQEMSQSFTNASPVNGQHIKLRRLSTPFHFSTETGYENSFRTSPLASTRNAVLNSRLKGLQTQIDAANTELECKKEMLAGLDDNIASVAGSRKLEK